MLFISLTVSAILLVAANRFVYRRQNAVAKTIGLGVGLAFAPLLATCLLPTVALQGLLLGLAVIAWRVSGRGPSFLLRLSCGATLVAYTFVGGVSVYHSARLASLYPDESMEERVPAPAHRDSPLTAAASDRLERVEAEIEGKRTLSWYRNRQLELLHEHTVELFVNSPGFGVMRMIYPNEEGLKLGVRAGLVPNQPGRRIVSMWSPGKLARPPASDESSLGWMFEDSVEDFVFSRGWGHLRDRRHVTGFVAHKFSEVPVQTEHWKVYNGKSQNAYAPTPTNRWRIQTLDLIGLLVHDEPVAYVSDRLPAMDELRTAPTRPLDKFETVGLITLRQGEDLFISRDGAYLRMLGGISSAKQCVACHGGERGDLLGAFSYVLRGDAG